MPERDELAGGERRQGRGDSSEQDLAFYLRTVGFTLSEVAEAMETGRNRVVWLLARGGLCGLVRLKVGYGLERFWRIFRAGGEGLETGDAIPESLKARVHRLQKASEKTLGCGGPTEMEGKRDP